MKNQTTLKVHYKLKAIPIIQAFVVESARYFGASEAECQDLKLATEEAAAHIINNYPESENGYFDIFCSLEDQGIFRIVLSNTGPPIDKEHIPEYKVEMPEHSIEGLQFYLIKKLTDNFFFLNKGKNGWQTILEKRLAYPNVPLVAQEEKQKTAKRKGKILNWIFGEKLQTMLAAPEDAYLITKLSYTTYRYSYAKTIFYYPEMLKEALENTSIISFVAKNSKGDIVIHMAYMRSPYSREIVESGAMMSMPEYRGNIAIVRLLKLQKKFALDKSNNVAIVENNLVTGHISSQKFAKLYNFMPFAIKLSVHNRSKFIGMREIKRQRESLLYTLKTAKSINAVNLYVPQPHKDIAEMLFSSAKIPLIISEGKHSYSESTKIKSSTNPEDNLGVLEIEEFSENWKKDIKKELYDLTIDGIITVHLYVTGCKPLPKDLDDKLNEIGFFFSGIVPQTLDKWQFLYTHMEPQRFDFNEIKVADDRAKTLREYVEKCYRKVIGL